MTKGICNKLPYVAVWVLNQTGRQSEYISHFDNRLITSSMKDDFYSGISLFTDHNKALKYMIYLFTDHNKALKWRVFRLKYLVTFLSILFPRCTGNLLLRFLMKSTFVIKVCCSRCFAYRSCIQIAFVGRYALSNFRNFTNIFVSNCFLTVTTETTKP